MSTEKRNAPRPPILLNRYWARSDLEGGPSLIDRLWAKVQIGEPDECWPFTGCIDPHGYGRIGIGGRGGGTANAHRVVAEFYYGSPKEGDQARHLCGNRECCNPSHLAWGDQSANEADKLLHGRSNRGERHGMGKLKLEQVLAIRRRAMEGESQRALGREFAVAQQTISEIVTGRTWAWVEGGDAE